MEQRNYIARTSGLRTKDYVGYGLVDAAGCLIFSLVTTLLQKYYTDVLHLGPLFIMLMFMAARVWDAINDPIMGRIADTMKPGRFGRYRPWLLYAAAPLALSGVLMFVKLPGMGEPGHAVGTAVFATCTYILFGMVYTVLQIPYGSLASVVTTDDGERASSASFAPSARLSAPSRCCSSPASPTASAWTPAARWSWARTARPSPTCSTRPCSGA